jgi:undecaprenyl-diphosphatase
MSLIQIVILAVIQGLAELLPVSSSAHVIAAEKLMHIDPSSPQATLLLVMLHTGTMFAVIVYFWKAWKRAFFSGTDRLLEFGIPIIIGTAVTGVVGLGLKVLIEHIIAHGHPERKAEVEELFGHLEILAAALAAVGVLILWAGFGARRRSGRHSITLVDSLIIGAVQGLALPFRGFSRSGSTISAGLLRGIEKVHIEEYSFALAVVLTPFAVLLEARRLIHHQAGDVPVGMHDFTPSLIGMVFSFAAGLLALRVLSRLLERGQWWVFGVYCLVAAGGVFGMYMAGYSHDYGGPDAEVTEDGGGAIPIGIAELLAVIHVKQDHQDGEGLEDHLGFATEGGAEVVSAAFGGAAQAGYE